MQLILQPAVAELDVALCAMAMVLFVLVARFEFPDVPLYRPALAQPTTEEPLLTYIALFAFT